MLVIRQAGQEVLKLIQVRCGYGWYEDGILITSYAANGSSNAWLWTVPTKAVLAISGCGAGGGGGAGYDDGANAGSGGGGGGSGLGLQNLIVFVPAGEIIRIAINPGGLGGVVGVSNALYGDDTTIEFTSFNPGDFDTLPGGNLGNGARLLLRGGQCGFNATTGATGFGKGGCGGYRWSTVPGLAEGGQTSGAAGTVSLLASPPYMRQVNGGGAGGNPGASGGGNDSHVGHGERNSAGGATADGAGGGGGGGVSIFGPSTDGGAGHANATAIGWGYGSGGAGGGGNSAGNSDAGNGAQGRPGYVEILYMSVQ